LTFDPTGIFPSQLEEPCKRRESEEMDPVRHGPLNDKTSGALATGEVSWGDQATVIKMTWKRATQQASVQQKPEKKSQKKVSFILQFFHG